MRKWVAALVVGLSALGSTAPVLAAPQAVTGKIIDLWCYGLNKANTERDHKGPGFQGSSRGAECAMACVKWDGAPVGIVTSAGKVYQLAGDLTADNNTKIAAHLGHTVTITGDVSEKDGMSMLSASMNDLKMAK